MSSMMRLQTTLKNPSNKRYIIQQDTEPNTMHKTHLSRRWSDH